MCLQENAILKIENLCDCLRLEELWLFSNKIAAIENLDNNKGLKHLNLADNQIKRIDNVSCLTNLSHLDLSGNPITSLNAIDNLSDLSMLKQLAFSSPMFEPCAITELPNYRCYVLTTITAPNFSILDNERLTKEHIQTALNEYIQLTGRLLGNIEDIENIYQTKVNQLELETKADEDALSLMQEKCIQQLNEVKETVDKEGAKVEKEYTHLKDIRKGNEEKLKEEIKVIAEEYKTIINTVLKEHDKIIHEENEAWDTIMKAASLEVRVYEVLNEIMSNTKRTVVFAEIHNDSPEYLVIQKYFIGTKVKITGACLIYNDCIEPDTESPDLFYYVKLEAEDLKDFLDNTKRPNNTYDSLDECTKTIKDNTVIAFCKRSALSREPQVNAVYCLVLVARDKETKKIHVDDKIALLLKTQTVIKIF